MTAKYVCLVVISLVGCGAPDTPHPPILVSGAPLEGSNTCALYGERTDSFACTSQGGTQNGLRAMMFIDSKSFALPRSLIELHLIEHTPGVWLLEQCKIKLYTSGGHGGRPPDWSASECTLQLGPTTRISGQAGPATLWDTHGTFAATLQPLESTNKPLEIRGGF